MSIGACWHALLWLTFALTARCIAGQAIQNGCNANGPRVPCGGPSAEAADCLSQGCCYEPAPGDIGGTYLELPACFMPNDGASNYAVRGSTLQTGADGTQQASLDLQGNGTLQSLGSDISPITLSVENIDQNILRVKMGANGRFEVPGSLFQNTGQGRVQGNPNYGLQYSASPFGFAVTRVGSSTAALFNTAGSRIVFKDQYLELTSSIPSSANLFGLGEFTTNTGFPLRRDGLPYTLWTQDQPPAVPNINLYGSHPVILDVRDGGLTHGVMLMNSNGMEVVLTSTTLQFRAIGGILDFYFLLGPTPMDVLNQFTSIVGRPVMPPYWSLGLMQSKNGYNDIQYCEQVVANYIQNQIPLETFVTDIQYLDQNQDFTLSTSYPLNEFQTFVARLHKNSQRWVPILDPQIHIPHGYAPYDQGIAQNVFIRDMTGQPYNGQLWPGAVNFPDFFAQQTIEWWTSQIQGVHSQLPLDGLWIDMHEPSNFCTGDICVLPDSKVDANTDFYCKLTCSSGTGASPNATFMAPPGIYDPPYKINNNNTQLDLNTKTVPLSGRHLDGNLSYNLHNLYGLSHSIATYKALTATINKRPFVLSRSTFLGSGAWTAHWTGDTESDWNDLQWSIGDMLQAGMAGIPFVGADICGFNNYATEELCARWAAAGAWQPYARNHHADGFQEFYIWPTVTTVAQKVFAWRLRILPYHYTAFFDSHTYGCSVMRPLFFPFPGDASTYYNNYQWMLGDALLVAPILSQGTSTLSAYFPQGVWYSLYNFIAIDTSSGGQNITVQAQTTDNPPVYILGGNIVPVGVNGTNNTSAARAANLTLVAALPGPQSPFFHRCGQGCAAQSSPSNLVACGHMYLDQGEEMSLGTSQNNYLAFEVRVVSSGLGGNSLQGSLVTYWPGVPGQGATGCSAAVSWPLLQNVTVLGVPAVNTASVAVQDIGAQTSAAGAFGAAGVVQAQQAQAAAPSSVVFSGLPLPSGDVAYDSAAKVLSITNLGYQLTCPNALKITWQPPTSAAPSGLGVDG